MLVATAGHVDHGKTSLVKHLTGTDTDRLAEEKRRGLTIELGYAFCDLDSGARVGFIDVPGHHRFINTMISGISGIDLGLLVVAADDGPMPQTLEHLQVLKILGVKRFAGVITKTDLVDEDRLQQVREQVGALLPGAPLCEVSNLSGAGMDHLLSILEAETRDCPNRDTGALFRMYIDRVFIRKGAGLVVTGTALAGTVKAGDTLRLHMSGGDVARETDVRVREVHAQGLAAQAGMAGQRCALNLSGKVSLERVHRGDFLCAHPTAVPGRRLDTRCWTVADPVRPFKHLGRIKLHVGSRRIGARTYLIERAEDPSDGERVQLLLDKPVLAFAGDRFVIREDNEGSTLGGGIVIDPEAPRKGKSRRARLQQLDALEVDDPSDALEQALFDNAEIVSLGRSSRIWNLTPEALESTLTLPRFANPGHCAGPCGWG